VRRIPAALQAHLQSETVTVCRLLKITLSDGRVFGVTTLDRDVVYMGLTYSALNGFDTSIIATDTGLSVDNAEATALVSATVNGITAAMALRGELDNATWELYLVNWADLTMGHVVLDAGDLGEVTVVDGMTYIPELLSYAMRLRQAIGHVWSRRCRAEFGTPAEGHTGCGVDAESLWMPGVVTGVDPDDPFRVFADSSLTGLDPEPAPGRVRWLTGNNTSQRLRQIEAYGDATGTIALFEPLLFPVQVGDTFEIRRDCNKSPSHCIGYGNLINYKGEPFIPVGDGLETMTPSAQVFGGLSGSEIID
jgi:uncharacterized phage protein (TIGR02218 family)